MRESAQLDPSAYQDPGVLARRRTLARSPGMVALPSSTPSLDEAQAPARTAQISYHSSLTASYGLLQEEPWTKPFRNALSLADHPQYRPSLWRARRLAGSLAAGREFRIALLATIPGLEFVLGA